MHRDRTTVDAKRPEAHLLDYVVVPYNAGEDYHRKALEKLITEQASFHGENSFPVLAQGLYRGDCRALLCVRKEPRKGEEKEAIGLATFTDGISPAGAVLHLEDLVVSKEYRHHGFGTYLMASFLCQAAKDKVRGVKWFTMENNEPARRTFRRFGEVPCLTQSNQAAVLEIEKPYSLVSMSEKNGSGKIEPLSFDHINDVGPFLNEKFGVWGDYKVLAQAASSSQQDMHYMSFVGKVREKITSVLIAGIGYSTFKGFSGLHVGVLAFRDNDSIAHDLPLLFSAVADELSRRRVPGATYVDVGYQPEGTREILIEGLKALGASPLQYNGENMIPGAFLAKEFHGATSKASKFLRRLKGLEKIRNGCPHRSNGIAGGACGMPKRPDGVSSVSSDEKFLLLSKDGLTLGGK